MPTYRYRCAKCGEEHEVWQSFEEKPKTRHTGGCGGKLTKVLSPAGIVLKGSGFYKTDNRSSSRSGSKRSSSSESSGSGSESSGAGSESSSSSVSSSSSSSGSSESSTKNDTKQSSARTG